MIYPSFYEMICRIRYRDYITYQKIKLDNYSAIRSMLPLRAKIDALVFHDGEYMWTRVREIDDSLNTRCGKLITDKSFFSFFCPQKAKFGEFVSIDKNLFSNDISKVEFTLGVIISNYVKSFKISKASKKVTLFNFLNSNFRGDGNFVLYANGRALDIDNYYGNFKTIFLDYINSYENDLINVYLTYALVKSDILTPMILGGEKFNISKLEKLRVPIDNYWIFQLIYGNDSSIYFEFEDDESWGPIDVLKLKTEIKPVYTKSVNACRLDLKKKDASVVFVNDGFVMRFY
jgi:hypothetical protein